MTDGSGRFPVLAVRAVSAPEFIRFWSSRYRYPSEHLYREGLAGPLDADRLEKLYIWKNGGPLSAGKLGSVRRNFAPYIDEGIELAGRPDAESFLHRFRTGGAIWRIFFLHCCNPSRFPIFDQHVWRAHQVIFGRRPRELGDNDPSKIDAYLREYVTFWSEFAAGQDATIADRALWAFGKTCKPMSSGVDWQETIADFRSELI